ncbi:MAG: histidine phosphatase family protein [Cyanobacteria bacterium J06634_5]
MRRLFIGDLTLLPVASLSARCCKGVMNMACCQSISLIRHGPPAVSLRQRVRGHQFRSFVERYDAAKIARHARPSRLAQEVMAQADFVLASNLPRAVHTAELLGVPVPSMIDARFREIDFPVDFPRHLKFSALTWSAIAIALWRLGYSARSEPFIQTKQRACSAADVLEARCDELMQLPKKETGAVVLVAHGGINRLIAKELRTRGWRGPRLPRSRHWGCTTYCR